MYHYKFMTSIGIPGISDSMDSLIWLTISILLANIALLCKNDSSVYLWIKSGYVVFTIPSIGSLNSEMRNSLGISIWELLNLRITENHQFWKSNLRITESRMQYYFVNLVVADTYFLSMLELHSDPKDKMH